MQAPAECIRVVCHNTTSRAADKLSSTRHSLQLDAPLLRNKPPNRATLPQAAIRRSLLSLLHALVALEARIVTRKIQIIPTHSLPVLYHCMLLSTCSRVLNIMYNSSFGSHFGPLVNLGIYKSIRPVILTCIIDSSMYSGYFLKVSSRYCKYCNFK